MALLAVIVPVLSDSDALDRLLADLPPDPDVELIVVDGGNDPSLDQIAGARPGTQVVRSAVGRGVQMNAGAAASSAPLLFFLHADATLPAGWKQALIALPGACVGGWFRFALDDSAWQARLLERLVAWRVRVLRLPYGDQGIFVRRDVFDRLGGFRPWPLMEDVDFVRRLSAVGRVCEPPLAVRTSARRWRSDGWLARSTRNVVLVSLYFAGVAPQRLARWYAGR
jgi:rSAM/selenodomain-associated transferase 2